MPVPDQAIGAGVAVPGFSASLGYFDTYRRAKVPANLVQARAAAPRPPSAAPREHPACTGEHRHAHVHRQHARTASCHQRHAHSAAMLSAL